MERKKDEREREFNDLLCLIVSLPQPFYHTKKGIQQKEKEKKKILIIPVTPCAKTKPFIIIILSSVHDNVASL